jgi:hypothetical protein
MLSWTFTNKSIKTLLLISFGLYFVFMSKVPNMITKLSDNIIYRAIIIILIIYFSNHDNQLTIMLVVLFLMSLNKNNIENFGYKKYDLNQRCNTNYQCKSGCCNCTKQMNWSGTCYNTEGGTCKNCSSISGSNCPSVCPPQL